MVRDQGFSVTEVCRSMELGETGVQRWVTQYDAAFAGGPEVAAALWKKTVDDYDALPHIEDVRRSRWNASLRLDRPCLGRTDVHNLHSDSHRSSPQARYAPKRRRHRVLKTIELPW
jgi:hypothetical protein